MICSIFFWQCLNLRGGSASSREAGAAASQSKISPIEKLRQKFLLFPSFLRGSKPIDVEDSVSTVESFDLSEAPWFGCLTFLAVYKPSESELLTVILRLGHVVAVLIQILFLGHIFFREHHKMVKKGLCLGNDSRGNKMLMSGIAWLICLRTVQRSLDNWDGYQRLADLRAASPLPLSHTWLYPLIQASSPHTCQSHSTLISLRTD